MQGKSILVIGRRGHVPWLGRFRTLSEDAAIDGQTIDIVADVAESESHVAAGTYEVIAVCDPTISETAALERTVELAGATRGCSVLVQDASGDVAVTARLSHRMGLVELRFGWPIGEVVPTGRLSADAFVADLWLRSIYRPKHDDPVHLPVHEEAEAVYWDEVRRVRAARPPRY